MSPLLEAVDLHVTYGKIEAVKGISFYVNEGEVVTLVGSNGAGKTTTLRALSGLHRPAAGEIRFNGERIDSTPAHEIVSIGLGHSPEGRHVFARMTIEENLLLGAFLRKKDKRSDLQSDLDRIFAMFPVLGDRREQAAGTLSGGEQQMLAMGRALMNQPKLLMLDEPSMGLSPIMMQLIMSTVAALRDAGTTVLLVEQNALAALKLADRGYVLEGGHIVLEDTGANLLGNEDVQKAYLGQD